MFGAENVSARNRAFPSSRRRPAASRRSSCVIASLCLVDEASAELCFVAWANIVAPRTEERAPGSAAFELTRRVEDIERRLGKRDDDRNQKRADRAPLPARFVRVHALRLSRSFSSSRFSYPLTRVSSLPRSLTRGQLADEHPADAPSAARAPIRLSPSRGVWPADQRIRQYNIWRHGKINASTSVGETYLTLHVRLDLLECRLHLVVRRAK